MAIVEKLISEQNQYDLFYNILLSIKSKNPSVSVEEDTSKGLCKLESNSISIMKTHDVKTEISSFNIKIVRELVPKIFSKNTYKYSISINGNTRGYSSFKSMYFKSELLSSRCNKLIADIFDYLFDIEEQRKIDQTNNAIRDIKTVIAKYINGVRNTLPV